MKKFGYFYTKFEDFTTNLLMIGVVIFVFAAAMLRSLGHPIAWSVGFAQMLFAWVIFLGANKALRHNKHIGVDFLVKRLPTSARDILEIIISLFMLAFLVYIGFYGMQLSMDNASREITNLDISYSFVTSAVPVGCLLMSITLINKLVSQFRNLRNSKQSETREG